MKFTAELIGGPLGGEVREFWETDDEMISSHIVGLNTTDPKMFYTYLRKGKDRFEFAWD
jgi:hypothetical protein